MDLISLDRWLRLAKTPAFIPKPWLAMEQDLYPGGNATCLAARYCVDNASTTLLTCRHIILPTPLPLISKRSPSLFVVGWLPYSDAGQRGATVEPFFFCIHMDYTSVPFPSPFVFLFFFSINSSKGGGHYDETG